MLGPYPPLAVANEFIRLALPVGGVDHMKLQKLVYYAHGYALSDDEPLVDEQPQVWKFGPVFNTLYFKLKYHGEDPIVRTESDAFEIPRVSKFDTEAISFIKDTWKRLKDYDAIELSKFTHKSGTPWSDVVQKFGGRVPKDYPISAKSMGKYFRYNDL